MVPISLPLHSSLLLILVELILIIITFRILMIWFDSNVNVDDSMFKKVSLLIVIFLLPVLFFSFIPITETVTYASLDNGEVNENIKLSNLDKNVDSEVHVKGACLYDNSLGAYYVGFPLLSVENNFNVNSTVNSSDINKLTLTTKKGELLDSNTFNDGSSVKKFKLGEYIEEEPEELKILSLDNQNQIIKEEEVEIEYTEEKKKLGLYYLIINNCR